MAPVGRQMSIVVGVVVVLVCAAVVYFLYRPAPAQKSSVPTFDSGPNVSKEVSDAVQSPAEQLPETNPFSGYKNPFE